MLPETFGSRQRGRAIVEYRRGALPRPPLNLLSVSGCALREKTKRTFRYGIAVRSVGTRASTGIREMRVMVQDEDTDADPDAWRGKTTVYEGTGRR